MLWAGILEIIPPYGSKPVGTKEPNALGLYDLSGNVWEWCWNWFDQYSSSPSNNPTCPNSGSVCMLRGGSWNNDVYYCRIAYRTSNTPSSRLFYFGFRLCRSGL
ncbi:MAG: formylglycine-generating enzyme family protein [Candidatus Cloacimonadaceae bacterium]|nr:formylglycine-generating enzyme family protein [Candidatus Cloacimonadota bacterium]MDY0325116.1 formylglycine-generating enzyme family protein [Candidatus Cloacimonadaceae bacterium]